MKRVIGGGCGGRGVHSGKRGEGTIERGRVDGRVKRWAQWKMERPGRRRDGSGGK